MAFASSTILYLLYIVLFFTEEPMPLKAENTAGLTSSDNYTEWVSTVSDPMAIKTAYDDINNIILKPFTF